MSAMAPNRQQTAKPGGTSSTNSSGKEDLLKARALKRAERVEARRVEAEVHKEAGNVHFRAGHYDKAIKEYDDAIQIHGPSPAYLTNMAAAWFKMGLYDLSEFCAQRALVLDPRFIKARYRRGLARKANLEFARAAVDFQTVLEQDPDSTEAKNVLRETFQLMLKRVEEEDDVSIPRDEVPLLSDTKVELESASDSSDWNHEGNGIPCKFYNHDGCMRGADCRFSHAPDHKSLRDRLGRNVCMYFLLGNCKFGGRACIYAHVKTYLPPGRWWEDEDKSLLLRIISTSLSPDEKSAFMPFMSGVLDDRLAWKSAHGVEMEEEYGHWRVLAQLGLQEAVENGLAAMAYESCCGGSSRGGGGRRRRGGRGGRGKGRGGRRGGPSQPPREDEWDPEMEERRNNYGFTEDEVMELLSQGVKPWDDDAWDVRDALYSL